MMLGTLDEQHSAALAAEAERQSAVRPGAVNPVTMPDGTTMLIRHGSGGAVQARPWLPAQMSGVCRWM